MTAAGWEATGSWAAIVVTLGIAVVGWARANRSERQAKTADAHADEALALARSAEARADRLERIALEKRDVTWERQLVGAHHRGVLSFMNVGSDPAYDVALIVDPVAGGHERKIERFARIEPAERIGIHLTALAQEAETRAAEASPGVILTPNFTVRTRITWRSESGVPNVKEWPSITV